PTEDSKEPGESHKRAVREKRFRERTQRWNERFEEGHRYIKKVGVYRHYYRFVLPQTFGHVWQSFWSYMKLNYAKPSLFVRPDEETQYEDLDSAAYSARKKRDAELPSYQRNPRLDYYWVLNEGDSVPSVIRGDSLWRFENDLDDRPVGPNGHLYEEKDVVYV